MACHHYLSFASFLLYLLSKDREILPQILSGRVFGTPVQPQAELRGKNFGAALTVQAEGLEAKVVRDCARIASAASFSASLVQAA